MLLKKIFHVKSYGTYENITYNLYGEKHEIVYHATCNTLNYCAYLSPYIAWEITCHFTLSVFIETKIFFMAGVSMYTHGVSNHQQLDCSFNILFKLI